MVQINDFGKILDKIIILLLVMVVGFLNGFHYLKKRKRMDESKRVERHILVMLIGWQFYGIIIIIFMSMMK